MKIDDDVISYAEKIGWQMLFIFSNVSRLFGGYHCSIAYIIEVRTASGSLQVDDLLNAQQLGVQRMFDDNAFCHVFQYLAMANIQSVDVFYNNEYMML